MIIIFLSWLIITQNIIIVTNYSLTSEKIKEPIKIVVLSDLHNKQFGKDNVKLVQKIEAQMPDIIAVVGDMNMIDDTRTDIVTNILKELADIAPVYYSLGNHENDAEMKSHELSDAIKQIDNVTLLVNESKEITVNGNKISILGLSDFAFGSKGTGRQKYYDMMDEFSKADGYQLLLCHFPEYYPWFFEKHGNTFDLMLSGHAHGGVANIPFVGRLYAPNQGWFPKYAYGEYNLPNGTMIITGGLGTSEEKIRINNPPEILSVNISAK
ncbi:phosphoesterase [Clostridia bacterium]|nr:phosphoesterase [Clostridia bacterium]